MKNSVFTVYLKNYLILVLTAIVLASSVSHAQVVVIPLGADSVNKGLVPVAVGSIDSLGGISHSFGISSVSNPATGVYEINVSGTISPTNPIVMLNPFTIGFGIPEVMGYEAIDSNSFRVRVQDASGTARDSAFSVAVYNIE